MVLLPSLVCRSQRTKTVMILMTRGEEDQIEFVGQLLGGGGRSGDFEDLRPSARKDWRTTTRTFGQEQKGTRREKRRLRRQAKRKAGRNGRGGGGEEEPGSGSSSGDRNQTASEEGVRSAAGSVAAPRSYGAVPRRYARPLERWQ